MRDARNDILAINSAFIAISRRAEGVDRQILARTFVDTGSLLSVISSKDHQIIFGRRGTGKTHALLCTADRIQNQGNLPVYVDLRTVGSSGGIYGDTQLPLSQRATRLLLDVFEAIHQAILEQVTDRGMNLAELVPCLNGFAEAITEIQVVGDVRKETKLAASMQVEESSKIGLGASSKLVPQFDWQTAERSNVSGETFVAETGPVRHRVHFGRIARAFEELMRAISPTRVVIMVDEWSVIPMDLQPFLADLIRRAVLPVHGITVKVAAIQHRSNLRLGSLKDYTGIEVGADMSADIDLDDFMVFAHDKGRAVEFFQELLYRHYVNDDGSKPQFHNAEALIRSAFTEDNAFQELVHAAEGVPRDCFYILSLSIQKNFDSRVSASAIRAAARLWFHKDKADAIRSNDGTAALLRWIIVQLIAEKAPGAFLVNSRTRHSLLEALFDARIVHLVKRNVAVDHSPGDWYDLYKLDFGCYAELVETPALRGAEVLDIRSKQPTSHSDESGVVILDLTKFQEPQAKVPSIELPFKLVP